MGEKIIVDKTVVGRWRVTLNNPPINVIDDEMYDAFYDLIGEVEADKTLNVVTFESANIAHYGTAGPRSRLPSWIDTATRLAKSSVLSIAVIRGAFAAAAVSLLWPATCASPAVRRRFSVC
jgi:enoyl-CoA hydratase/carnithine racemase